MKCILKIMETSKSKYLKFYFFFCLVVVSILAAGLRSGGDPDYLNYLDIYEYSITNISLDIEPFYRFINSVFYEIDTPFEVFIFIFAFSSILIKSLIIYKNSEFFLLSYIIYLLTIFLFLDVIAIRQGLAISFVMVAFYLYERRAYSLSFMALTFASLFHISAIIILPFILLAFRRFSIKHIVLIFLITLYFYFFGLNKSIFISISPILPNFIYNKFIVYLSEPASTNLSAKQILIMLCSVYVYRNLECSRFTKAMCVMYWFGALFSVVLSPLGDISFRIRWYFFFSEMFFMPVFFMRLNIKFSGFSNDFNAFIRLMLLLVFMFFVYGFSVYKFILSISERGYSLIF